MITVGGLVIRTRTDVRFIAPAVRDVVGRMVTAVPNPTVFVDDDFKRLTANRRFNAGVMTMFGLIALAIGAVGVYGTMAFLVAQGLPAIGLRLALGATPGKVLREVLTNAIRWVVLGTCAGLLAAFIFARALTSLLFGIVPGEPTLYLLVAAVVVVIGLLGALEPAVRASRVDPLTVLRRN